jgi:hypothetical protein
MVEERKRSRRGEASYADVCGKVPRRTKVEEIYSDEFCSESEGWQRVERRRRERRTPLIQEAPRAPPRRNREAALEDRVPKGRRRREAFLIKVEEDVEWLQVYRRIMPNRSILEGATGVRRTRVGHILIEFDKAVPVNEAAAKLRAALSGNMEVAALVNRATVQIKNIDPFTSREELV